MNEKLRGLTLFVYPLDTVPADIRYANPGPYVIFLRPAG